MKKKLLVLVTTVLLAIGMVACSKPTTIEEYYAQPAIKEAFEKEIDNMKESYSTTYSDISYSVKENKLSYTYTLAEQIEDVDAAVDALESSLDEATLDSNIKTIEDETGISGVSVEFIYINADGSEIYRITYPYDDSAAEATEETTEEATEETTEEATEETTEEEVTEE